VSSFLSFVKMPTIDWFMSSYPFFRGNQFGTIILGAKNRVTLATANKDRVALHLSLETLLLLLWGEWFFTLATNIVMRGQQDNPG
jgi:hypothetical protein